MHEAWLKLASHIDRLEDRRHFFAIASRAMRRVLTDHAKHRKRLKRDASRVRMTLDESLVADQAGGFDLVDLDDCLSRLAELNARHARVVELRVFGGLTIAETAATLGVSDSTIEKDWFTARGWLRVELDRTE